MPPSAPRSPAAPRRRPAKRPRAAWNVYILRCRDGSLYTGIATDVPRRLAEHAAGSPRGAKYLRGRGPLKLVFTAGVPTREVALRLEARIKRMPKAEKEALLRSGPRRAKRALSVQGLPLRSRRGSRQPCSLRP